MRDQVGCGKYNANSEVSIINYLNELKLENYIQRASARQISKVWIFTSELIYNWGMSTLEDLFEAIDEFIPEIYEFVDVEKIKKRAFDIRESKLNGKIKNDMHRMYEFMPLGFESDAKDVISEIITISEKFQKAFKLTPSGIEKAEAWLYPYALKAGADADLEALIYFKSKGESLISSHELSEKWKKAICVDVERDRLLNHNDEKLIERAKKNEISLFELADIFEHSIMFPRFLSARDAEEDFISTTFFRAVEWFGLNEYEPWTNVYAQEISTSYQGGVDQDYSLFELFYYCRSDFLLKKASKLGLEALLYGICVGNIDASKPWKRYREEPDKAKRYIDFIDYIPTASIIAFAWQRINPTNISREILDQALLLLFQTQLISGAWPQKSQDENGSVFSTCLAIIALSVTKPKGYQRYVEKAKEWLLSQQNEVGCWYIQGSPAIMINILCIEAIKLAEGSYHVTYTIKNNLTYNSEIHTSIRKQTDKYIIFCEGNFKGNRNLSFDEKCYTKIFSMEFPNAVFCSVGSCKDIETEDNLLFETIKKINPSHIIIKLLDRDDRSLEEIDELKMKSITVLSLRELESYLLEDEIIEKLCMVCDKSEKFDDIVAIKAEALRQSISRRNPEDDLKSAAGLFFTDTKIALGLTQCGNDKASFLRDTMAPLITQETNTYTQLRKDIFGI